MADSQDEWMDDDLKSWIKESEGTSDHMYKDSKGYVTIGHGHMIPDANAAKSIPFRFDSRDGRYATSSEVESAFGKVSNSKKRNNSKEGFSPDSNREFDKIYLDEDEKDRLFQSDMKSSVSELYRRKDMKFDSYPNSAKKALFDMQFNMGSLNFSRVKPDGSGGFKPAWPKMFDAMEKRDWKAVSKESHRVDVSEGRNQRTRELFMSADEEEKNR